MREEEKGGIITVGGYQSKRETEREKQREGKKDESESSPLR